MPITVKHGNGCQRDGESSTPDIFDAAVTVIIGRVRLGIEPHTVIENGPDVFEDMAERYQRLGIEHRWKQDR